MPGHPKRYGIDKLVYFAQYAADYDALQHEKNIKHRDKRAFTPVFDGLARP
jgi:predicted GIY-YIG superfamily endonuclease